ncbi:UNVERIFIED_CONTAM: hypothetical protein K2H54_002906 [Gekko kuhli]
MVDCRIGSQLQGQRMSGSVCQLRRCRRRGPGWAKATPKRVLPAISSSEEEGGPSLQDLAAKIAALEWAKATKHKRDEVATPMAAATPKRTRAAAHKQELRALYAQLAQLHESDDDGDDQQAWVEETTQSSMVMDLPHVYMACSQPLGDHLLRATKAKIGRGEYAEMFTLLFRDVEVKASIRDDPRELEKIWYMQVDKNFDNWLLAYTIYMGVVLQAYPDRGSALVEYQDLIHRAYKEYSGAARLRCDELFHVQAALDPTLPWDQEHKQL